MSTAVSPDFTISGPLLVCSSGTPFSLSNVASSASITWTATPSNLFTVSNGGGANATLTAANNANGQGTLTFTINSNCGNQLQVERTVWVGLTQYLYFSASYSHSQGILLSTPYVGGGATAQWSVNGVQHGSRKSPKINEYLFEDRDEKSLQRIMEQAGADIMALGHTHKPYHRVLKNEDGTHRHAINIGSVGKPKDGDNRACYVLLEITPETTMKKPELKVEFLRVAYDFKSVAQSVEASPLPNEYADMLRKAY